MNSDKKILDDIAKAAGGAINIIAGLQAQVREDMRARVGDVANKLDLVPRADFDEIQDLLKQIAKKVDTMEKRVNALEKSKAKQTRKAKKS